MELDEYKIINRGGSFDNFKQSDRAELIVYNRSRAHSVIVSIKRSLRLEMAFSILFVIFDCYLIMRPEYAHLRTFAAGMLVFSGGFIFYIHKLYKYIKLQYLITLSIREQLEGSITILKKFINLYFQLTTFMTPLILLLVLLSVYGATEYSESSTSLSFTTNGLWSYICAATLWSLIMYFFTKWYVNKLYGKHLNSLSTLLKELQEAE